MRRVFRQTVVEVGTGEQSRHASKSSGGFSRNQHKKTNKPFRGIFIFPNEPVKKGELLATNRGDYGVPAANLPFRVWDYNAGSNTKIGGNNLRAVTATCDGVATLRKSKINPTYKWIDVEPDVQKVYRSGELRDELERRNQLSPMNRHNESYLSELCDYEEPGWRDRVLAKPRPSERYRDPNLLSRGVVRSLDPGEQFCYE
jgi:hypothetical protein